ncbi:hypothetical protein Kisp01_65590 [Kineosporia sp. NBRC 101677]|uniref:hypothetical protein n=1 Tax=Kineosporia sp. NBRC 101677 TaxID=3032197 RepID=UPI0024A40111|nr:hypothetical protein [Kineosporia sp. NBRC 101677]GLY19545.1 hypothetical protein Kisp01_65590 [Kineosporia sp. NBRC 101677]
MSRVLRIELRRSAAVGSALGLAVIGSLALYFADGIMFSTGWMHLAMSQRLYLVLLWPLMLAAGAWQARREHRSNVSELFTSTPRPVAQRILPTLGALAIAAVAGYLVMGLAGAAWIFDTASYLPATVLVITVIGALALVAAAWLGLAIGRLLPSPVTAPIAGVTALGLLLALPMATESFRWLGLIISPMAEMNMPGDYATVPGRVSAAQSSWLVGLAATSVLLLVSRTSRSRVAAVLPVAAGLALSVVVIPHENRLVYDAVDPVARELVCAEGEPQVCLSRAHESLLPEVTAPAREALAVLKKLPGAPAQVHEDTYAYPDTYPEFRTDTVLLHVATNREGHLANRANVLTDVLTGAFSGPRTCETYPSSADQLAAAHWLMGTEPVAPEPEGLGRPDLGYAFEDVSVEATKVWQHLSALPEEEALSRVAALRQAAVQCKPAEGLLR